MFTARRAFMTGSPPPPTIASFSPTSLNNGTGTVTINGTNFVPNSTTVTVGGTAATSISVNANLQSLTAAFPSKGRGTYSVVVTTPGGSASANYTYTVVPSVSGIAPSSQLIGTNTTYTLYGSRFISSGVNGVYVYNDGYIGCVVDSESQLRFTANFGSAGYRTVVATAPDGWSNGAGLDIYVPAPTISSASPNPAKFGNTVTVSGSNFGYGITSVTIGGVGVSASVGASSLTFSCPNLPDGFQTITISGPGGSASSSIYVWAARTSETTQFTSSGTYNSPGWASSLQIVVLGGGGGGYNGAAFGFIGGGGGAGQWAATTINGGAFLSITVGAGAGPVNASPGGGSGGTSSVSGVVAAAGGANGAGQGVTHVGYSPGNYTYGGVTYSGGAAQSTYRANGNAPGGGGGGGDGGPFSGGPGGPGADGSVWIRAIY